jgi:hypothetical protein
MNEKLVREVERTKADLDEQDKNDAARTARRREIDAMPDTIEWPFWCGLCKKDVRATGYKVELPYAVPVAVYEARCPSRHIIRRRITDRIGDSFYDRSRMVSRDRTENMKDMLQPTDIGFNTHYGNPNKRYEEAIAKAEREAYGRKR